MNKDKKLIGTKRIKINTVKNKHNQMKIEQYFANKFDITSPKYNIEREEKEQIKEITKEQVENAINRIKTENACGKDEITPEIIKWMGEKGKEWLWEICKEA